MAHIQQEEKSVSNNAEISGADSLYEPIRVLGKGGSALVYLVKSKERSVDYYAMKKIALDESKATRKKEHVLKEAHLLSRLKHPHIVTCHSFFFDKLDDYLFILQDFCDDGTIFDKVSETKSLNCKLKEDQILSWFVQVVMAMQYIHSQKILHRDIKSQNVFLTKVGIAKLGDFGIARVMENTVDLAQTCIGTPCYLSPEVCQDLPYSSKADIWALGCLLYEMCMLQYPFDAGNIVTLYYKIVKGKYEEVSSEFSLETRSLISEMLQKSAESRPNILAVMNNQHIQDHLKLFLTDCESKHKQLCKKKNNNKSSIYSVDEQKAHCVGQPVSIEEAGNSTRDIKRILMSSKDTGIYADDFVEESESDYSDDFEDSDDDDDVDDNDDRNNNLIRDQNKFTSIVENARNEVERERNDLCCKDFAESDDKGNTFGNTFRKHFEDILGPDTYSQVVNVFRQSQGKDSDTVKKHLLTLVDVHFLDTCFLLKELMNDDID